MRIHICGVIWNGMFSIRVGTAMIYLVFAHISFTYAVVNFSLAIYPIIVFTWRVYHIGLRKQALVIRRKSFSRCSCSPFGAQHFFFFFFHIFNPLLFLIFFLVSFVNVLSHLLPIHISYSSPVISVFPIFCSFSHGFLCYWSGCLFTTFGASPFLPSLISSKRLRGFLISKANSMCVYASFWSFIFIVGSEAEQTGW